MPGPEPEPISRIAWWATGPCSNLCSALRRACQRNRTGCWIRLGSQQRKTWLIRPSGLSDSWKMRRQRLVHSGGPNGSLHRIGARMILAGRLMSRSFRGPACAIRKSDWRMDIERAAGIAGSVSRFSVWRSFQEYLRTRYSGMVSSIRPAGV